MKRAADFRGIARKSLSGRWGLAIIAGLVASVLGACAQIGPDLNIESTKTGVKADIEFGTWTIPLETWSFDQVAEFLARNAFYIATSVVAAVCISLLVSSVVRVGYCKFNLELVDGSAEPKVKTLFDYFKHFKPVVVTNLHKSLLIFLWSLLLVVPGIITAFSYAMVDYILAENPEISSKEALKQSEQMMEGKRWRLFCLEMSFIGWGLLSALTGGIGQLWLIPYTEAASAAFYREVSGTGIVTAEPVLENE
ncbi:MAG: DUF975 family protein [Clostridia bacterium]|nr:DUF975 family protein [Clostridia bacterium]